MLPACHIPGPERPGPPLGGGRASGQACSRTGVSSSWNCFLVCSFSPNLPAGQLGERTRPSVLQGGSPRPGGRGWAWGIESGSLVSRAFGCKMFTSDPECKVSLLLPSSQGLCSAVFPPQEGGLGREPEWPVALGTLQKGGMQAEALSLSPSALPELPVLVTCRHPQKVLLGTGSHRALGPAPGGGVRAGTTLPCRPSPAPCFSRGGEGRGSLKPTKGEGPGAGTLGPFQHPGVKWSSLRRSEREEDDGSRPHPPGCCFSCR